MYTAAVPFTGLLACTAGGGYHPAYRLTLGTNIIVFHSTTYEYGFLYHVHGVIEYVNIYFTRPILVNKLLVQSKGPITD